MDVASVECVTDYRFTYDAGSAAWQTQVKTKTFKALGTITESTWTNKVEWTAC